MVAMLAVSLTCTLATVAIAESSDGWLLLNFDSGRVSSAVPRARDQQFTPPTERKLKAASGAIIASAILPAPT